MRHRLLAVCIALLFGFALSAVAGSAAGGGAQVAPADNSSVSTYKVTDTSVGASARDSAGASSSQASGPSSTSSKSASSTSGSSSNGAASSNGSGSSGYGISPRGTTDSNQVSTAIAREKVIDTGDKAVDTAKPAKAESSDKTFAPGLLDTVSDISKVSAQGERGAVAQDEDSQFKQKPAASEDKDDSHKKN